METIALASPMSVPLATDTVLLARLFAAVSEPIRLHLLLLLLDREYNVGELVHLSGASQGRVSIHLQCVNADVYLTQERRPALTYPERLVY